MLKAIVQHSAKLVVERYLLKDIMTEDVIALDADSTLKEASKLFARYNSRALPVIDAENKIVGVVPYRDIVGLKQHFFE